MRRQASRLGFITGVTFVALVIPVSPNPRMVDDTRHSSSTTGSRTQGLAAPQGYGFAAATWPPSPLGPRATGHLRLPARVRRDLRIVPLASAADRGWVPSNQWPSGRPVVVHPTSTDCRNGLVLAGRLQTTSSA